MGTIVGLDVLGNRKIFVIALMKQQFYSRRKTPDRFLTDQHLRKYKKNLLWIHDFDRKCVCNRAVW